MRIVYKNRNRVAVLQLLLSRAQRQEIFRFQLVHDLQPVVQHADDILLHRCDAGTGKGVMELREQQVAPGVVDAFLLIDRKACESSVGSHLLHHDQVVFQTAVHLLDAYDRGIAALHDRVQAFFHHRQFLVPDGFKILVRRRMNQIHALRLHPGNVIQVLPGGAAAVVAHAPEVEGILLALVGLQPSGQLFLHLAVDGIVPFVGAVDDNLRPFIAAPDEVLAVEVVNVLSRADVDIVLVSALLQHLHQAPRMAEGVEIHRGDRHFAEFVVEIEPSTQNLAENGLSRGHIAVRLQKPSAYNLPSSLRHLFPDPFEQFRLVFLHPLVYQRLVMVEHKVRILVDESGSRAVGRDALHHSGLPLPKPHRIQMRIAKHISFHCFSFLLANFCDSIHNAII